MPLSQGLGEAPAPGGVLVEERASGASHMLSLLWGVRGLSQPEVWGQEWWKQRSTVAWGLEPALRPSALRPWELLQMEDDARPSQGPGTAALPVHPHPAEPQLQKTPHILLADLAARSQRSWGEALTELSKGLETPRVLAGGPRSLGTVGSPARPLRPRAVLSPSGATSTSLDSRASPGPSAVTARTRKLYFLPCSASASVKVVLSAGGSPTFSQVLRPACRLSTT